MTVAPGLLRAGLALGALVLAGLCLFGLWHVVVGGLVNGNPRAATFGAALAATTGGILGVGLILARRARDG